MLLPKVVIVNRVCMTEAGSSILELTLHQQTKGYLGMKFRGYICQPQQWLLLQTVLPHDGDKLSYNGDNTF